MKSYKIVFILPLGKYTINNISAENVLVAIGRAASEVRKEYPIYPYDVFSVERIDLPKPVEIKGKEGYYGYDFNGHF